MTGARVRVDRTLFAALAREVERSVTTDARPVVARLAAAIAAAPGPAAYRKVYRKLATGIEVRPVPGQPPSITISGSGGFSGGGSISSLIGPYEYGHRSGDMQRAPRSSSPSTRRARRRRGSQFPPRRASGHWVGPAVLAETERLAAGFAQQIDKAIDNVTRRGGI